MNKLNQGSLLTKHQDFTVSRKGQERQAWEWIGTKAVPETWKARKGKETKKSCSWRISNASYWNECTQPFVDARYFVQYSNPR